jgi:hypothetical protein
LDGICNSPDFTTGRLGPMIETHPPRVRPLGSCETSVSPRVLLLSSHLLTDRMLVYNELLPSLTAHASVRVWALSGAQRSFVQLCRAASAGVEAEAFPEVRPFREYLNLLRRLNELVWDFRQRPPSRLSHMRHFRQKASPMLYRVLGGPARTLAALKAERRLEDWLERRLLAYPRSPEAVERLRRDPPDVLLTTGPHQYHQPAIAAAARALRIRTLAMIPSWDNLSTKNRMVFKYDGYAVWSEQMKRDLHHFYPQSRSVPVYVVGALQFDVFHQVRFARTREQFCRSAGLSPDKPIILYALGSPNLFREHHGALSLARRLMAGDLGDVQMLVRPHPAFDKGVEATMFREFGPRVVVQHTGATQHQTEAFFQDEPAIVDWVNSFRHADVVVNMSSTAAVDAALCDRPVVNLDYDPAPDGAQQEFVKDVNHRGTHFKPVAESGGVWLVENPQEMVQAVRTYLQFPELHRAERRWIVQHVCGFEDGHNGRRLAEAILDFAKHPVG